MLIEIPTREGMLPVLLEPGRPTILLGPNGTGKSRLGIYIDDLESCGPSHRIAAQRSLELPDEILSETYEKALVALRRDKSNKRQHRPSAGSMEYGYDQLLVTLFAEHHRALEDAHQVSHGKAKSIRPTTLLDRLQALWGELIPHQRLAFLEGTVRTVPDAVRVEPFEASQMSDGERLVVYVLGQALLLEQGGVLIVDEPELHMSRALLVRLWDAVEQVRADCCFVYITHDVDFAASRQARRMYAVRGFDPPTFKEVRVRTRFRLVEDQPPRWDVQPLPSGSPVPPDMLVRIVGSRKPILFVEGETGGLDQFVYREAYSGFAVVPVASCAQVLQIVRSFRDQSDLHWLRCAGLVDRDNRTLDDSGVLETAIYALPVNELENIFLVPDIFLALAATLSFDVADAARRLELLKEDVFAAATRDTDLVSLKHARNRVHEAGRSFGMKAKDITDLSRQYDQLITKTDPKAIYDVFRSEYRTMLRARDYKAVLVAYDNKGLMALAAARLGLRGKAGLEELVLRALVAPNRTALVDALRRTLPRIDSNA